MLEKPQDAKRVIKKLSNLHSVYAYKRGCSHGARKHPQAKPVL